MSKDVFDKASEAIASHYPEGIRQMFIDDWRHSQDLTWINGQQAVELGATPCQST